MGDSEKTGSFNRAGGARDLVQLMKERVSNLQVAYNTARREAGHNDVVPALRRALRKAQVELAGLTGSVDP